MLPTRPIPSRSSGTKDQAIPKLRHGLGAHAYQVHRHGRLAGLVHNAWSRSSLACRTGNGLQQLLLAAAGRYRQCPGSRRRWRSKFTSSSTWAPSLFAHGQVLHLAAAPVGPWARCAQCANQCVSPTISSVKDCSVASLVATLRHILALAQNHHPVGNFQYLVKFMGDDDNGLAVLPHTPQHIKQSPGLLRGQYSGGLVQNQNIARRDTAPL